MCEGCGAELSECQCLKGWRRRQAALVVPPAAEVISDGEEPAVETASTAEEPLAEPWRPDSQTFLEPSAVDEPAVEAVVELVDRPVDALVPVAVAGALTLYEADKAAAREYAVRARADNTRRLYATYQRRFEAYATSRGQRALPASPELVAAFLAALAREPGTRGAPHKSTATLDVALAAIAFAHKQARLLFETKHPVIEEAWAGIRHTFGTAPVQKAPFIPFHPELRKALREESLRNRALILFTFHSGGRRSESLRANIEQLVFVREPPPGLDGIRFTLPKSKTDQQGEGKTKILYRQKAVDICGVAAVEAYLASRGGPAFGPLFPGKRGNRYLSGSVFSELVKRVVTRAGAIATEEAGDEETLTDEARTALESKLAGLNPDDYSSHSIRAGVVTMLKAMGKSDGDVQAVTGHEDPRTVARYDRRMPELKNKTMRNVFDDFVEN